MRPSPETAGRYADLLSWLRGLQGAVLAFSGGVDSALLLAAAREALGDRLLAVTLVTPYTPADDVAAAKSLAAALGTRHLLLERPIPDAILANPPERCYLCKRALFGELLSIARAEGLATLLEGSNADDLLELRPGFRAVQELGVQSPLLAAGLVKAEIRRLARAQGLAVWNRPSGSCLLTRLPHGATVTEAALRRIDAGEGLLRSLGFLQLRLRSHGELARIEVPPEDLPHCTICSGKALPDMANVVSTSVISCSLRGVGRSRCAMFACRYSNSCSNRANAACVSMLWASRRTRYFACWRAGKISACWKRSCARGERTRFVCIAPRWDTRLPVMKNMVILR